MKPRRTVTSNHVFRLEGGNEDNDLWVTIATDDADDPIVRSTWVPNDDERKAIAAGKNIELVVWGAQHPPVMMRLTDETLGRPPQGGSSA